MKNMILESQVFWFVVYTLFLTVTLILFQHYGGIT